MNDLFSKSNKFIGFAFLVFLIISVVPPRIHAEMLEKQLSPIANSIVSQAPGDNGNRKIQIEIVNSDNKSIDGLSRKIAGKLELAILSEILKQKKYESIESDFAIKIKGTYQISNEHVDIKLEGIHINQKTGFQLSFDHQFSADHSPVSIKREVLILNLQTNLLTHELLNRFSNDFRNEIKKRECYLLLSDRIRPNTKNCQSLSCLSKLGKKLQVKYILRPKIEKIKPLLFLLSADFIDVNREIIVSSVQIKHAGYIAYLIGSLEELSKRVAIQEHLLKIASEDLAKNQGHLLITSEPTDADLYLDGIALPEDTNVLLRDMPAGEYKVTFRIGGLERENKIWVEAGKIKRIHAILKLLKLKTLSVVKPSKPEDRIAFKLVYTQPLLPESINSKTFFVKMGGQKIPGETVVQEDTILFRPEAKLIPNKIYEIVATKSIKSTSGDLSDVLYVRRYRHSN